MERVTEQELAELKRLSAEATKRPWTYRHDFNMSTGCSDTHLIKGPPAEFAPGNRTWRELFLNGRIAGRSHADAAFIAMSGNLIDRLIAEIEEYRSR